MNQAERRAVERARWLAELEQSLGDAQRLLGSLEWHDLSVEIALIEARIRALRAEVGRSARGRPQSGRDSSRTEKGPDRTIPGGWLVTPRGRPLKPR